MLHFLKMSNKLNSYQSIFANWLLYLTLVWSVVLFSGYVEQDYFALPAVTHTELIEPQKTVKTTISFYESVADVIPQKTISLFSLFFQNILTCLSSITTGTIYCLDKKEAFRSLFI